MLGIGWMELLVIALVGFFVFGPERLPEKVREATQLIRRLRDMAQEATEDLKRQLPDGEDLGLRDLRDLRDLHPKRMMMSALFDDEVAAPRPEAIAAAAPVVPTPSAHIRSGGVPPYDVDAT